MSLILLAALPFLGAVFPALLIRAGRDASSGAAGMVTLIAFVGLIAPHMARRRFGHDLRRYAPAALGIGAGLLCLCDALSRLVVAPGELPVGVLTALLGGPAFLALLIQRR